MGLALVVHMLGAHSSRLCHTSVQLHSLSPEPAVTSGTPPSHQGPTGTCRRHHI